MAVDITQTGIVAGLLTLVRELFALANKRMEASGHAKSGLQWQVRQLRERMDERDERDKNDDLKWHVTRLEKHAKRHGWRLTENGDHDETMG